MESVLVQHEVYGFFGKVPAVGDFVQRNLAAPIIASLDAWLQEGMYLLGQTGQIFHDRYMVSQVGFFVLPQKVWADQAVAGFIMPSVDRVGRLFPLVFLQSVTGPQPINLGQLSRELAAASDIALSALQRRLGPDELYQRLTSASAGVMEGSTLNHEAATAFTIDGTQSIWWRAGDVETGSVSAFDPKDVHSIFSYLYQ